MWSLIWWAIYGSIVGGVAKAFFPGKITEGWLPAIGLGVAGSVIGGLPFGEGPAGFVGSVLGAIMLIVGLEYWRANRV